MSVTVTGARLPCCTVMDASTPTGTTRYTGTVTGDTDTKAADIQRPVAPWVWRKGSDVYSSSEGSTPLR